MKLCPQCGTRFSEPGVAFCPNDGSPTQPMETEPPPDPLIGRVIDGRYRVERPIGEGGMGVVYQITHSVLGKRMALKVLRREMANDADVVQRFIQEAQSATSIGHSNIVDISDFGRLPDGSVYFVMEYLDGQSLTRLIRDSGPIPPQTAIHIVRQIADALDAAHSRGIVHRDLKPDNVYLIQQGNDPTFVKILDFGIAKVGGSASKLTRTGMIFGTPHYMSPEQAAGHAVDRRTDAYALGVIMYEIFTGRVPFDGDTFMGILSKHMFEQPPPPSEMLLGDRPRLGPIEQVIIRLLAKKPDDRYQTMSELVADLDRISGGQPPVPSRPSSHSSPGTQQSPRAGYESEDYTLPIRGGFRIPYSLAVIMLFVTALGTAASAFWISAPPTTLASSSGHEVVHSEAAPPTRRTSRDTHRASGGSTTTHPAGIGNHTSGSEAGDSESTVSSDAESGNTDPGNLEASNSGTANAMSGNEATGTVGTETGNTAEAGEANGAGRPEHSENPSGQSENARESNAAERWVQLVSRPTRAEVLSDGILLGYTPLRVRVHDEDEAIELRVRGYEPLSVTVNVASPETLRVALTRLPRRPFPTSRSSASSDESHETTRPPAFGEVLDPWAQ